MIKQALVLAGGKGTRLGDLTRVTPKPLLEVGGIPFLGHVLWNLRRHGVRDVVVSVGHLADAVVATLGDGERYGLNLSYVREREPLGTGGALLQAASQLHDNFFVLNGDTLFDVNLLDLAALHLQSGSAATLALRQVPDAGRFGRVQLTEERITAFTEKTSAGPGLVNGGVYAINKAALAQLPPPPCSLELAFERLAETGSLAGREYRGFFVDIGLPKTLAEARTSVLAWRRKPAVFLDRDGVLNVDRGYVHRAQDFAWLPGAPDAVRWLNNMGYLAIVVTNQAGIGRGYYGEEDFESLCAWMQTELEQQGAHIDAFYHCPHHPEFGLGAYRQTCTCRKPAPGMIVRAAREWDVDLRRSLMIGDKPSDLAAARAASVRGLLFRGGDLREQLEQALAHPVRAELSGSALARPVTPGESHPV